MPRAIWSGTISFGLVSVPARMYPATESKELRFHFLGVLAHLVVTDRLKVTLRLRKHKTRPKRKAS